MIIFKKHGAKNNLVRKYNGGKRFSAAAATTKDKLPRNKPNKIKIYDSSEGNIKILPRDKT